MPDGFFGPPWRPTRGKYDARKTIHGMFQGFAQSIDRFNRQENKNSPKAKAALMGAAWWVGQLELVFDFWDSFGLDEDECVLLSDATAAPPTHGPRSRPQRQRSRSNSTARGSPRAACRCPTLRVASRA